MKNNISENFEKVYLRVNILKRAIQNISGWFRRHCGKLILLFLAFVIASAATIAWANIGLGEIAMKRGQPGRSMSARKDHPNDETP